MGTNDNMSVSESQQSGQRGRPSVSSNHPSIGSQDPAQDGFNLDPPKRLTPYERVTEELNNDSRALKEITLGKRIGFYRIRNELGTGNFSQVKLGIHVLTKEKVAIKMLDKTKLDQKTQRLLSREISCMERLHHPNIIRLYEVIETLAKLHLVMEYAGGGELFTKITNDGKIPEPDGKLIFTQVVSAVHHMHSKDIIHRDLKAENIFYTGAGLVKVGDFGFSTYCKSDEHLNTFCGSPPYAAPELFKDEHYVGMPVDIWALGIMLYFMVTGVMPFRADTVAKLKKCIIDGQFTIPNHVSSQCQELIRGMLKLDPSERLLAEQLTKASWLAGQEFPPAHRSYHLTPSFSRDSATEEELTVLEQLKQLGIQDEQLAATKDKDSRDSITGTYRIVLHRCQRKEIEDSIRAAIEAQQSANQATPTKKKSKRKSKSVNESNKPSKLCSLL
ncbi:Serine/threonine-protein kinase NIM1 [Holothuria leucospilota]|uniref:Serine/threonine-protein kinase NIM1 n=1 Tax=Holothuria leucospilota TaxID=206669 RepID=A0A9Q1C9B7_HOLLE|nr:Serine/threonine-protein kinase NIM1 [Holothuria leucospilota]